MAVLLLIVLLGLSCGMAARQEQRRTARLSSNRMQARAKQ